MALTTLVAACLLGLSGCVAPQTYDEVHVRDWTRDSMDRWFPVGTKMNHVFAKLGNPSGESSSNGLKRWDYAGGASGQRYVSFFFKNGVLVEKHFASVPPAAIPSQG